jgi:hypothetical protein
MLTSSSLTLKPSYDLLDRRSLVIGKLWRFGARITRLALCCLGGNEVATSSSASNKIHILSHA